MPANVKINRSKLFGAMLFAFVSAPVLAVPTFDASETTTNTGAANHIATITMLNTAPASIAGFDFELTYDPALLTATTADITVVDAVTNAGVVCQILAAGTVTCFANHPTDVYPGDVQIQVSFDVGATEVADPGTPLTFTSSSLTDGGGNAVPAAPAPDDGAIIIGGAPPVTPPTISATYAARPGAAGQDGQTVIVGDIDFTITAPAANGGTGDIACTDTDAGNPPVLTINPANQTGITDTVADATVSCALILDTPQAGSVQCVINGGAPQTFAVTCPAGSGVTPAPSQPAIIPTNSLWSKLALVGLLAALGLLVVGLRRQQ